MIPVCEPTLQGNELKYVTDTIKTGWIYSAGSYLQKFEEKFAEYCTVKHGVSCCNGTVAIHLAIEALGIGPGDEIIIPTFTMAASCNGVIYAGAKPVLVDSELDTWNIDIDKIEEKITPRTKAIMVVHTYGHPVDMDKVKRIADKHNLYVIEDAAEAHGAEYKGRKTGSLSDIATFSFYANKIVTCFPPETKILIEPPKSGKGLSRMKKISELKVGDSVLTYNLKTAQKEYKKVTKTFKRDYNGNLLEISFSNHNHFQTTPNHPVYVLSKGWVRADQLSLGDEVIQYIYRGLAYKEMYTGKNYTEIMGPEVAERKRKEHALIISQRHAEEDSTYAKIDWSQVAAKISLANRGRKPSKETRKKFSQSQKERWSALSAEDRSAFSQKMKEIGADPAIREKKRLSALVLGQDFSYREKVSKGVLRAMEKDSYWEHYLQGMNLKPNRPEQHLQHFLEQYFPGEFGYNGDCRLKVRIDRLIPDFVHLKGKRKVIDLLGSYWHKPEEYDLRRRRYNNCGYDSLILWENELKNKEILSERIKTFIYNPKVKIVKVSQIIKKNYSGKVHNIETVDNHNYFAHGILVHNCGEGGMVVTNNDKWAEEMKKLRNHYFGLPRFIHPKVGYNYRLTNLQAAIGLAQLERIDELVKARRNNAQLYNQLLAGVKGITTPPEAEWAKNVYWMYGVLIQDDFGKTMPQLRERLEQRGVETRTFFIGMHKQPMYLNSPKPNYPDCAGKYPGSDELERKGFYLPSSSHLTKEQIEFIVEKIKEVQELR